VRLRDRVAAKKPQVHSRHTVTVDGVAVPVEIRRVTSGQRAQLLQDAIDAQELDETGKPRGVAQSLRLAARVLATLLYEGDEQAFPGADGPREVMELDEFDALSAAAGEAFTGEATETTQGNSDALTLPSTAGER